MWDPGLSSHHFLRDRELERTVLFQPADLEHLPGARRHENAVGLVSPGRLTFRLPVSQRDLSYCNTLFVEAFNASASLLLADMRLIHGSENRSFRGPSISVSGGRYRLEPAKWLTLRFHREDFGVYGHAAEWTDLRELVISFGKDKIDTSSHPVRVLIRSIGTIRRHIPQGPRLTEEGLASCLRGGFPGVPGAHKDSPSVQADPRTRPAFHRASPWAPFTPDNEALSIPAPLPACLETAEAILSGSIMGFQLSVPLRWNENPKGELEWGHFFHRHHFFRPLVRAFGQSQDPRYVAALDGMITSWIKANPVPIGSHGGAGPGWETLSTAWRLREWLWVAGTIWETAAFRSSSRTRIVRSLWEHATSLLDHTGHPNNWIIVESAALTIAGICLPQFETARQWREVGFQRLLAEVERQFLSDGAHFELSPLYHSICLHSLLEVLEAAQIHGHEPPRALHDCIVSGFDYLAALCRPDFTWPAVNDSGGYRGDYHQLMAKAGRFFERPDFAWIGSRGRSGAPLRNGMRVFPAAGIATVRSDPRPTANWALFRAGPPGFSHVHEDTISVEIYAGGLPRLIDPGISTYAPSPWTDWYRSSGAHNTVLVDGKGLQRANLSPEDRTRPPGAAFQWANDAHLHIVAGHCRGPWEGDRQDISIARFLVFVKGAYWLILDRIWGSGTAELTTCWHFAPGVVELDPDHLIAHCHDQRAPGFTVQALTPSPPVLMETATGSIDPPRGWVSCGGTDVPAPAVFCITQGRLPRWSVWGLFPSSTRRSAQVTAVSSPSADEHEMTLEIFLPMGEQDRVHVRLPNESLDGNGNVLTGSEVSLSRTDKEAIRTVTRLVLGNECA